MGYFTLLKKRDENGCRNVIVNVRKLDVKKFTFENFQTAYLLILLILVLEPKTQISGVSVVVNLKDSTMQQLGFIMSHKAVENLTLVNYVPLRYKKFLWVGIPAFGDALIIFVKSLLSEKLKSRISVSKDQDFDVEDEEIEDIRAKFLEIEDKFENFRNAKIDLKALKKCTEFEAVGSFRKLDID